MDILVPNKDVLYINSASRSSGTSSQFNIDLRGKFAQPNNYDHIVLTSASIPKSYYLIGTFTSTFTMTENSFVRTVTIPTGNYTFTGLASQLATSLTASSLLGLTFSVTGITQTGKYLFSYTGAADVTFDLSNSQIAHIIGFDHAIYTFTSQTLTSANVVNLQLTSTLQIQSNIVGGQDTVLSEVIPTIAAFGQILFTENSPAYVSKPLNNNISTNYTFWITDSSGRQIDLNGLDWQCVVVVYKADTYHLKLLTDKKLELMSKSIGAPILEVPEEAFREIRERQGHLELERQLRAALSSPVVSGGTFYNS